MRDVEARQAEAWAAMLTHYDYSDRWYREDDIAFWLFTAAWTTLIIGACVGY